MKIICADGRVLIPRSLFLVVCCLFATIAIFCPRTAFRIVDLPTFGLPIRAINPDRNVSDIYVTGIRF